MLASGNDAIALLGNTGATGAILVVLILIFGPISGAHFNPAVTLALTVRRMFPANETAPYILAQIIGGLLGVLVAHFMFELETYSFSSMSALASLNECRGCRDVWSRCDHTGLFKF